MQQEIYKRSKAPVRSVLILFGDVLLGGILIGGVVSIVGRFFYLILVFPMLMGLAAGFIIKGVVVTGKVRSTLIVVIAGIFASVLIYGSMHFFNYLQFRNDTAKEIQTQVVAEYGQPAPKEKVQAYIDYLLVKKTGISGFIGFVLLEAKQGVSISHVGFSSSSAMNLGVFTWIYWLVEMGFIGWMAISPAKEVVQDFFCEHCNAWVAKGEHVGGIKLETINQAAELIKRRDFVGLLEILQKDTVLPSVEFYTRTCKTCNTFPLYLTGFVISQGRKGQVLSRTFIVQPLNSSERFALTSALATINTK